MNTERIFKMRLLTLAIQTLLVTDTSIEEGDAIEFAEFYPAWEMGGNYGSNVWLRYGENAVGRAVLYSTTRNVSNAQTSPDQPQNPSSYRLIGSSTKTDF